MLIFILGFIAGGMAGVGALALLQARRETELATRIRELLDPYDDTDGIKVKYVRQLLAGGTEENE